jgi:hypothetical protein
MEFEIIHVAVSFLSNETSLELDWSNNQFDKSSHGTLAKSTAIFPFLKAPTTPNLGRTLLNLGS